jgi:hypothetical protein
MLFGATRMRPDDSILMVVVRNMHGVVRIITWIIGSVRAQKRFVQLCASCLSDTWKYTLGLAPWRRAPWLRPARGR